MDSYQSLKHPITMVLYPNNVGFGYLICQGANEILDEGIQKIAPLSNKKLMKRVRYYFDYAMPNVVILRGWDSDAHKLSASRRKIINDIEKLAQSKNLKVFRYSRKEIKDVFQQFGSVSKFAIARQIASRFPYLKPKLPKYRKNGNPEAYYMGVFDCYALMITHFYLSD